MYATVRDNPIVADQIDYLGHDTFESGSKGMVGTLVKDTTVSPPTANQMDTVKDDWDPGRLRGSSKAV